MLINHIGLVLSFLGITAFVVLGFILWLWLARLTYSVFRLDKDSLQGAMRPQMDFPRFTKRDSWSQLRTNISFLL